MCWNVVMTVLQFNLMPCAKFSEIKVLLNFQ